MRSQILLELLLVGIYMHLLWGVGGQSSQCRTSSHACKILFTTYQNHQNVTVERSPCTCIGTTTCLTTSSQSITVNLLSLTTNMTVTLSFCQAVQTQRQCASSDVALLLSSMGGPPDTLEEIKCACNTTLVLHGRYLREYVKWYNAYVCQNFKPVCQTSNNCYVSDNLMSEVTYGCRCPSGTLCRESPANGPYDDTTYGMCLP